MESTQNELCVMHEKLTEMPFISPELTKIVLRRNRISNINIPRLNSIIHLDLYDNLIKEIKHIERCPNLITFDISFNLLTDNNIPRLDFLQELYLIGNDIRFISPMELVSLQKLDMAENNIIKMENLGHLTALRQLFLANNSIKLIEDVNLPNLQLIDLQYNDLEYVDCAFLPRTIEVLLLSGNKRLKKIKNWECLPKLNLLSIVGTEIDENDLRDYNGECWI